MDSFQLFLLFVLLLFDIAVVFLLFVVFLVCLSLLFSSSPHLSSSYQGLLAQDEMSYFFLDEEIIHFFSFVPCVFSVACCFKYLVKLSSVCVHLLSVCVDLLQVPGFTAECLLITSLPSKALRLLVDIARLAERFNMRSQSQAW